MTDSRSIDGPSSPATNGPSRRSDDITKMLDGRDHAEGLRIIGCSLHQNAHETSDIEVFQDQIISPAGKCDRFDVARTHGCGPFVNSSRETAVASWNRESAALYNGSTREMGVRLRPDDWAMAPEFVPGQKWHSRDVVEANGAAPVALQVDADGVLATQIVDAFSEMPKLCPELLEANLHVNQSLSTILDGQVSGEVCDLCQDVVLSALTEEERQKHITECIENHEKEMERSFAIQRSQEKTCGICMDIVWEKAVISEQRFGILSNCSHVFCLACIRKWRSAKQFESKIVRACPECRVKSDFVTPSRYWVEDKEDKKKLIEEYKLALSKKPCKYFDKGRGECPFNEKCFYLHALPDGRVASPKPVHRRRRPPPASSSQTESNTSHMVLYEVLDDWPLNQWEELIFHLNFFEVSLLSTSDEEDEDGEDDFDDSDLSGVM